jgi:oligoendopeptidase F
MNAAGIPVYARTGPHYLFEAFAIFNELLLLDHAVQTAATPTEQQAATERLLAKIALELFVSAEEVAFERALYTVGDVPVSAAAITARYQAVIAPYEFWPASDVGQARGWMRKSLLFEDPLYLVNYLYASAIAMALYERHLADPEFAAKYQSVLAAGFQVDPQALLTPLGIRLGDPDLVRSAARVLQEQTAQLDTLYARSGHP